MGRLVYSVIASLDGYVVDESGSFDWAAPDEEVHLFANELQESVGTHLYGRRMYEVMAVWEDFPGIESEPAVMRDFAATWRAADKVVYSRTLAEVSTPRTRLERSFDPETVRLLTEQSELDVSIGGPTLAARALSAGLVDDVHVISVPVVVGGGTPTWPAGLRLDLELVDQRRFAAGTVHQHYRTRL